VFAARVFAARVFAARVFAARVFAARVFAARVFPARVFPARVFPARVFPARVFPARVFPARVFPALPPAREEQRDQQRNRQQRADHRGGQQAVVVQPDQVAGNGGKQLAGVDQRPDPDRQEAKPGQHRSQRRDPGHGEQGEHDSGQAERGGRGGDREVVGPVRLRGCGGDLGEPVQAAPGQHERRWRDQQREQDRPEVPHQTPCPARGDSAG
jgi:hypothetical protein